MGHTQNFQSSGWGCQILPWSWDSKSRLIRISQGDRYKRGVSSENQVWRFNIHSPGLSFCRDRKSATRFSIPRTWTALKERNLSWDQRRRRHASLSRVRDCEPPWWFMWDITAILSALIMIWCPPRTGRKYIKARKTALSSRQFMCQERNSPVHSPLAGLPSKTAPQPVIDASVVIIWRRWIAPILTPLRKKAGSRHCKRGWEQLRDTLIWRVAGTVGCNLSSFIHQRNALMWSNPRGNTGEAAAMRQVPTETWRPSLKRARHAVKLDIRAGANRACIWMESKWTPRNTGGAHSPWRSFWGQENGCGGERYLCDDLLAPWSEPECVSLPDSSAHECPGASKGPVQHPCILWMFSAPRPGRRAGPCIGKPSLQRQTWKNLLCRWTTWMWKYASFRSIVTK